MQTFEIKDNFLLNGKPMKIISGAIHYFRIRPSQWEDSLYNLKSLGANTVETYVPWNIHEPEEGKFDFSDGKDICRFIQLAHQMGLFVILRPSVYICAEWEFGGIPAWLLKETDIRLRSTDPRFMKRVDNYFKKLLPMIATYQITQNGPIIMMQVENEYGSYGMDKAYLRQTKLLMKKYGVEVPLFTADGSWNEALDAGSLIDDDVFVAGNFGSHSKENSLVLQKYFEDHHKKWPIMCMEYWDGWFNRWGEPVVKRDPNELANDVKEMLKLGSINLYMFHGGTNFGFYNGCSARGNTDLPQVTSYDYDALLTEWGNPTEKYFAVQKAIKEVCPEVQQSKPRSKKMDSLGSYKVADSVSLFQTVEQMTEGIKTDIPLTMEKLGSGYGYILYRTYLKNYHRNEKLKIVDASDRAQVFINEKKLATQYQHEIGTEINFHNQLAEATTQVDLLVENLGRVNYGYKFNSCSQIKGIRGGIMHDIHFHQGFTQYALDFSKRQINNIDFSGKCFEEQPSFYKFIVKLDEVNDTFIDCSSYGKGTIFVNGFNLGRYWDKGPITYLYCPKDVLKNGTNEVIIFETEGVAISKLQFSEIPIYKNI